MKRWGPTLVFCCFVWLWIIHAIQSGWALFAFALWVAWIYYCMTLGSVDRGEDTRRRR